jgi:hypothetical protein
MSLAPPIVQRSYRIHGIGVNVYADEPAVIDAMDLRFRDFRGQPDAHPQVRFEFSVDGHGPGDRAALPPGTRRPVYETPHGTLYYFPDTDSLIGSFGGVRLNCDASRGVASLHSSGFSGRELYLATHPLATVSVMELLERRGLFSLHAACLATGDGRGVLLAGPSGAGKSTLALALARGGMSFVSDDVVFLVPDVGSGKVRVLGFADAVGLTEHTAERFSELRPLLEAPAPTGFPKRLRRIDELVGVPVLGACEPHSLIFPEVVPDRPSRIDPLDPRDALLRLVPDVLLTEPTATQAHLGAIAALLSQVSCYALGSGTDLERAAALVAGLVA